MIEAFAALWFEKQCKMFFPKGYAFVIDASIALEVEMAAAEAWHVDEATAAESVAEAETESAETTNFWWQSSKFGRRLQWWFLLS